mgnify:CR=1 FL=1
MASIRKRGENSYLLVVSRGYDYQGNRLKPAQKTVHPPKGLTAKQTEKWLNEQAVLYEREVKRTPGEPVDRSITLAKYIDVWLEQVAPKKLAASTLVRDKQDIRRILPALGHYKLAELNKDILRAFYDAMRSEQNWKTGGLLAEKTVEGIHSCLCGILSDAVEAGYITHNPAWRAYRKKGAPQERPVADEETVQRLITALEGQSLKYEVYFKLILATGMRRGEACGLRWSDIDWRQRALHIRRNVVKLSGQPILVKEPKTRAGVRVVYLSKELCKLLRVWQKESAWEKEQRGGGELEEETHRLAEELGVTDVITFPGFQGPEGVRAAMEKSEIYLVTSDRKEGWGAVVNEAMNSGCAVVADHMIGAAPWLIRQGENGRMYRDGEEQELFRTVERLLRDPGECRRLGENAQQTIAGEWNARTAAERLIELCRKMKFLPEMSEEREMPDAGQDVMQDITTPAPVIPQLWNDGPCSPAPVIPERSMYRRINSEQ